ncbi:hypothetical protein V8G54_028760 [Vigna mungo]|uniref:Uncharacterized protein n=1 Tax=Vigna mungo TaxID=3915 RepID=A0AAQ3MS20_VIGMU
MTWKWRIWDSESCSFRWVSLFRITNIANIISEREPIRRPSTQKPSLTTTGGSPAKDCSSNRRRSARTFCRFEAPFNTETTIDVGFEVSRRSFCCNLCLKAPS